MVQHNLRGSRADHRGRRTRFAVAGLALVVAVAVGSLMLTWATASFGAAGDSTSTASTVDRTAHYVLAAAHSGKVLDVPGFSRADGTGVLQTARNGGVNQQWRLTATGNGYFTIANVGSGKLLEVAGASTAAGAIVRQWAPRGTAGQQWKLADSGGGTVTIANGSSGLVLDVWDKSTADRAGVVQWPANNGANQHWTLIKLAGGSVTPVPPSSSAAPTATPATPASTAPVPTSAPTPPGPVATGPYAWHNAEIVGGGFVSGIVFNTTERDLAYARTDIGGAYRWAAGTKRWVPLQDSLAAADSNLMGVESVATDPVDPSRVYLAAGTYTNGWAGNGAILRSTDRGATMKRSPLPFKLGGNEDGRNMGERLAIDPNRNSTVYLGSRHDGLWRSTDFGVTWARVAAFPATSGSAGAGIGFVTVDPASGRAGSGSSTIYVGVADTRTGLYRSTDGGATWEAVAGQPTGQFPQRAVLSRQGALYLTYGNNPGPNGVTAGGVWKYTPGAGSWKDISPSKGGYGFSGLAVDASAPDTLLVSTLDRWYPSDEMYRSTNGGTTWTPVTGRSSYSNSGAPWTTAGIGHWIAGLAIDPFASGHVVYGTGDGIRGTDNLTALDSGGTVAWTVRSQGLEETAVIDLIAPPGGASVISALGDIAGFRHDDLNVVGQKMTNPDFTNTTGIDFAEAAPSVVVRVGTGAAMSGGLSTDGARTWKPFAAAPSGATAGTVAAAADASTVVWTPKDMGSFVSPDRGASWTAVRGLPAGARVVADRADARTFYALSGGSLSVSSDGGRSFTGRANGLPSGNLEAVPGRAGDLWIAAGGSGLSHSVDGGAHFTRVGGGVTAAQGVGFGKAAPGASYPAVYASGTVNGRSGVHRSVDGGATWTRVTDDAHQFGFGGQVVTGDPDVFGRVYIGTNGRGVIYGGPAG